MQYNNPTKHFDFYLSGGILVKPIRYDKSSEEVSYLIENNDAVCTCFVSDLRHPKGYDYMMEHLYKLSNNINVHV